MASLRPAARILTRQSACLGSAPSTASVRAAAAVTNTTPRGTTTFLRPATAATYLIRPTQSHSFHTFVSSLRREDDTFGSSGRRPTDHPKPTKRTPPTDFPSNDAYPDGRAPGEPTPGDSLPSGIPPSTIYSFEDVQSFANAPDSYPDKILIDVREPSELLESGRIPTALNMPIKSAPDAFFMSAEDFEDKYGFPRPGLEKEVVFYCKAGVRSKAAARLAGQAQFGGKYGEFPGSFDEWVAKGGKVQRE